MVIEVLKDKSHIEFTDTKERLWREKHRATLVKLGYHKKELVIVLEMSDGALKAMRWTKLTVKEKGYVKNCVKSYSKKER